MKFLTVLRVLFIIPCISMAEAEGRKTIEFITDDRDIEDVVNDMALDDPLGIQRTQSENTSENCQFFLTTSLENDTLFVIGSEDNSEDGYTHGHLTHITKSCDSGKDIIFVFDSRLFTEALGFYITPTNEIVVKKLFEEENKISIQYTNWRDFRKMYHSAGITIGTLSRDKLRVAGLEQKLVHKHLNSASVEGWKLRVRRPEGTTPDHIERLLPVDTYADISGVSKYEYLPEDKNREFLGGNVAVGKSYSLNGLETICNKQCVDYFRTEVGVELSSLKRGSHIYVFSEVDKSLPKPFEIVSVFAFVKVQKNEGGSSYNERALGLKFEVLGVRVHSVYKKRDLPEGGNPLIKYDNDEDELILVGLQVPF